MGESKMSGRLTGKSALISGGASGLGEAQATLYAREGASVLIGDLQLERGNAVVDTIAYASLYLASDEAKYVSGAELWVDGAWYAGQ